MAFAKPNLSIPLAVSYNERGVDGHAATVTNSLDQRKINCIYEPVRNAMTGQTTLYLAKRPGARKYSANTFGSTDQTAYLIGWVPDSTEYITPDASQVCVFSIVSGGDIRCSVDSATVVIENQATYAPAHIRTTAISNTPTLVLQLQELNTSTWASNQRVWYSSDIRATNGGTWARITDADFPASTAVGSMEHMDGYAFIASQTTGFIHNSDLNSLANWTANNKIRKQIQEDVNFGLARIGKKIVCFGYETMEVFGNAGHPTGSPLSTIPGLFAEVGLARSQNLNITEYYAVIGSTMYWVGRGKGRSFSLSLYAFNGSSEPVKVSTPAIDKILSGTPLYHITSITINGREAIAITWLTPNSTSPKWLMYFPDWKEWFEWNSTKLRCVNNGTYFLGTGNQNDIYCYVNDANSGLVEQWRDGTTDYTMTVQFQLPKDGNHRKRMPMCGVVADTARSASSLNVEFSDDDYQTWSTARAIDMTSQQKLLARCGSYRNRAVRLTHTGNLDCRIEKFMARIE